MPTNKELEKQLIDLRAFVNARTRLWLIFLGIAVVVLVVLLVMVFRPKPAGSDERIIILQREIEALKRSNENLDSLIKQKQAAYNANRPAETRIITRYEKIPVIVSSLDKEQLREQIANY